MTGTWKAGKRHGFGVFQIKKTGDVYRGHWEVGLKCGAGVYEYEDGELGECCSTHSLVGVHRSSLLLRWVAIEMMQSTYIVCAFSSEFVFAVLSRSLICDRRQLL
jgi:hypothetical protein